MDYDIVGGDTFPAIRFTLKKGDTLKAESGGTVAMTPGLKLVGKMDGGLFKAMGRMLSGESFFLQSIEAQADGYILLGSNMPGSITPVDITGKGLVVQKDGFLAAASGVDVSTKVQSLMRGFLGGEGFFVVKLTGSGTAFIATFGTALPITLAAGEEITVDNGHLVAWDEGMSYDMTKGASSWVSSVTTGQGLACRFKGPGRIWVQTRSPRGFAAWMASELVPFLPRSTPQK